MALTTPAAPTEIVHMTIAAYLSVGFAVAGIHAWRLLAEPDNLFHRRALGFALWMAGVAAVLQPISGDFSARQVAEHQPVKLAAMEGQFRTERGAPLRLGGWPDAEAETTRYALEIPYGLSLLAFHDPRAVVPGLGARSPPDTPPVHGVPVAFPVMAGGGSALMAGALVGGGLGGGGGGLPDRRRCLWVVVGRGPPA